MRQTVSNRTEQTGKSTTTRNVIAALSAAGRWTPPAWCGEFDAAERRAAGGTGTFPGVATHRVLNTDRIRYGALEKASGTPDPEYRREHPWGDFLNRNVPTAE